MFNSREYFQTSFVVQGDQPHGAGCCTGCRPLQSPHLDVKEHRKGVMPHHGYWDWYHPCNAAWSIADAHRNGQQALGQQDITFGVHIQFSVGSSPLNFTVCPGCTLHIGIGILTTARDWSNIIVRK